MLKPSELFGSVSEVAEAIDENIDETETTLEEDISHSVSLIDGAFKNIQEQILNSNRKELSSYKEQVLEVYNLVTDLSENQLPKYKKMILQTDLRTEGKIKDLKNELYEVLEERIEETKETIQVFFREEVKELKNLRASVVVVEKYIKENASDIIALREEVFQEIKKLDNEVDQIIIQEKLDEIEKGYQNLSEGLLNIPPSTDNSDPLTPLDQNFVTLDQLQSHYKLFVNRVQQQLATFGGGGEVRLEFLDDIDRDTALIDGRVLQYDATAGIWTGGIGGGGSVSALSELTNDVGFITDRVDGNFTVTGNLSVGGTVTYEDVTSVDSLGIVTARTGLHVGIDTGFFTEDVVINGDARVTGILTIGTSSITLNGNDDSIRATSFIGDGSALTGIATRLGDLVNDSGFITTSFTNTNQLTNGAGFITNNVIGVLTATSFSGDGSNLTGLSTFSGNYNDLTNTPTGIVTATGVGSSEFLIYDGSEYVGIASTGFRDYVINQGQGYYAYTTDAYTVGVANTTQEIIEGEWTLVQPQVASNGLYNQQPECMNVANGGDPWIGAGATIGTGQTEFSLAGTKPGTMCIVRTVLRFEPDTDETDLDMRLHFTTNTATQGTGLTNFNIEKQALVMTVGAAVTYSSEEMISFFVGDTLAGDTKEDAGSFCIEVNGTTDGTFEVLGVTVMIDI